MPDDALPSVGLAERGAGSAQRPVPQPRGIRGHRPNGGVSLPSVMIQDRIAGCRFCRYRKSECIAMLLSPGRTKGRWKGDQDSDLKAEFAKLNMLCGRRPEMTEADRKETASPHWSVPRRNILAPNFRRRRVSATRTETNSQIVDGRRLAHYDGRGLIPHGSRHGSHRAAGWHRFHLRRA
jgi:hypothetical protein